MTDIVNIRPADAPEGNFLAVGPVPRVFPPPDLPVRVSGFPERWLLKKSVENASNVFAGTGNLTDYKWIVKDNVLFDSSRNPEPGDFRFESAGDNLVVIGLLHQDLLLTYDPSASPQLTFQPANGSNAQRFQLIHVPKD